MHNKEGALFGAVFYKLLSLGIVVISVALVVWIIWAIVRTSAITTEAAEPKADGSAEVSPPPASAGDPPLANVRLVGPGKPDRIIEVLLVPVARSLAALDEHLGRLSGLAADAGFFCGGPS
ncbi:MAG: hypothetical protein JW889_14540 [Verrucomicrobia bacterium]|nr:hypothetical protein [Verrucomicrobiota bacterium]